MNTIQIKHIGFLLLIFAFLHSYGQERTSPKNQSEELGKVSWYRDYRVALNRAKQENKSVLILFQEIPGCSTCRNYGHNVLSNPLMTEAIENLFVPLAIYNNKGGKDRQILNKYNEPSWNNPVVRIVNAQGKNMVQRVAGNYSVIGLYKAMEHALKASGKAIPEYFKLLGVELSALNNRNIKEKYYSMYCFWSGEKHLGAVKGVLDTEAGFIGGHEVVKVTYDASLIDENKLTSYAKKGHCAPIPKGSFRSSKKDSEYYLQHSLYKYLPLTNLQKTKINSALGNKKSGISYLSPKQQKWLKELNNPKTKKQVLFNLDFEKAWRIKNNSETSRL